MHSVKILGHCPLGHGSKRKRPEGEAEDDASIDVHAKSLKVEMSQDDVASPSFTRKPKSNELLLWLTNAIDHLFT